MLKTLGQNPTSVRLQKIQKSPNYRNGSFQNVHPTPMIKKGMSHVRVGFKFFTDPKPKDIAPHKELPSIKTNLNNINDTTPALVWFGHSSYLIKYQKINILVDPVFSGYASPISTAVKSFKGSDVYQVEDMPDIDVLLLTHDHYDHIDFNSVSLLKHKTKQVICPLGCGEHLEYWGFDPKLITELDWWQETRPGNFLKVTATPARHFSGRGLIRNKTLWASYVLELGTHRIFVGGDSGYDDQFKKIGDSFKSFDLALVECGQYGKNWPYIHMFPEQTAQVARDLNAKVLMPVHWGKFVLSLHPWTEPVERVLVKGAELGQDIITPLIGEVVRVGENQATTKWWRDF